MSDQTLTDDSWQTLGKSLAVEPAALKAVAAVEAAGSGFSDVVMIRVYLTDAAHFAEFNEVYNAWASEPYAARTTIYAGLAPGFLVEIDALAVLDQ